MQPPPRSVPDLLAPHYTRFGAADRVLLTGHSHQAWPDAALAAQSRAWLDAARYVDDKWTRAFEVADEVRSGFRRLLDDPDGHIALAPNTHELVVRFLSALPLRRRPRLVATDGEFHTVRRQLDRLEEEGIEVARVPVGAGAGIASPGGPSIAERIVETLDDRTAAVLVSSVLYRDARIVADLDRVAQACASTGARLLVDAYHSLNVAPFSVTEFGLQGAFVVGGGYKYCQLGEGNCFLRFPPDCDLRPILTGWHAEFGALTSAPSGKVSYGAGHRRFAGSTYDPTSHYRAAAVFRFFREQGLDANLLRRLSQAQLERLASGIDDLDVDSSVLVWNRAIPMAARGGFLALETPLAKEVCEALRTRRVHADFRGDTVRLGPAPYVSERQLDEAVAALGDVLRRRAGPGTATPT